MGFDMIRANRCAQLIMKLVAMFVALVVFSANSAFSQIDFTGVWSPRMADEDLPERRPGPSLANFIGLPINDYARKWGLAYRPGRLSLPEHQCQVHVVHYIYRGPLSVRIWEERDPITYELISIDQYVNTFEQKRTIWMDGRPHPSVNAPHTWMGFSTGIWEGNMLTVTTTHIKQGWFRRENLPSSDEVTMVEHFIRNGDKMTHISVTEDPVYLEEPLIKSEEFTISQNPNNFTPFWPCEYIEEGQWERGVVPHYLPGENPFVSEYAATHNLPVDATLGGAKTMYPEYREELKSLPLATFAP
jgi:hypothetical protein